MVHDVNWWSALLGITELEPEPEKLVNQRIRKESNRTAALLSWQSWPSWDIMVMALAIMAVAMVVTIVGWSIAIHALNKSIKV